MSHVFLDTRAGSPRLYLSGDLQFDARDERLYHEPLALVPVALAARRARDRGLRVLILGGGDGLALREVLRYPEVAEAHVADRDSEVLRLGRTALAALNRGAFADPRVRVHARDARDVLAGTRGWDVLVYDLTYPGDVAGTALFSVPAFEAARAALAPAGVLAVNAVSPELTPQAFGCVARSLGAAGLPALPYAFELPSFREEGYGRWGFLFASARSIGRAEVRRLRLPPGAGLTPEAFLAGTLLPAGAAQAMRAAPNRTDELLYYLYNATPLRWEPPFRPLRLGPSGLRPGPRLTAADGFARWLREPGGRRSLETLLRCLPLSQRGQSRAALLEWSDQAEVLFREVDLRSFVDRALERVQGLPRAWVRELTALRRRLAAGLPPMRELLEQAYRVFAVYLLVLLLANLAFPDNLYAKGFSSSGTRGSGVSISSSGDDDFRGLHFSDPAVRFAPYRYRVASAAGRGPGAGGRVVDPQGREHLAQWLTFTDPRGGAQPVTALLALTPELQLLESGALAYVADVPGYRFLLEPGRLRVLDTAGRDVVALLPDRALDEEARRQVEAQGPLIDRAVLEHRRWLDWARWGAGTPPGRQAASELGQLEAIRGSVERARVAWRAAAPASVLLPRHGWVAVFQGVYLQPWLPSSPPGPRPGGTPGPTLALVTADGQVRPRSLDPPVRLGDEDRFLFRLLSRRVARREDPALRDVLLRWLAAHGEALGPPEPEPPGGSSSPWGTRP